MVDNPETNVVNKWGFSTPGSSLGILGGSAPGTNWSAQSNETIQALAGGPRSTW